MSARDSGNTCAEPFARFNPDTSSSKTSLGLRPRWVPAQGNLLLEQLSLTWPKQGTWDLGYAYELPMSERLTNESASSLLLPTPNAYESTPAQGYVEEVRENLDNPHKRLYLPGRKWHAQRTLSRIAPLLPTPDTGESPKGHGRRGGKPGNKHQSGANLDNAVKLLPTPGANDSTGGEGPTREARQEQGTGGPTLRDISHLLPSGESTPRPSYVGKEPSADVHPDQLTIEDA